MPLLALAQPRHPRRPDLEPLVQIVTDQAIEVQAYDGQEYCAVGYVTKATSAYLYLSCSYTPDPFTAIFTTRKIPRKDILGYRVLPLNMFLSGADLSYLAREGDIVELAHAEDHTIRRDELGYVVEKDFNRLRLSLFSAENARWIKTGSTVNFENVRLFRKWSVPG